MLETTKLVVGHSSPVAGPFDLSFPDGHCVMLCGPNGSGKSTLMKTLAGLIPPVSGSFRSNGEVLLVPARIPRVKGFTVSEFVRTSLFRSALWDGSASGKATEAVAEAVRLLGLERLAGKDLCEISDGEFQKACIATALTRKASVIMLDEPTAFLDVDNRKMVLSTLHDIARTTGTTVVFSTHDIYDGEKNSDSVLDLGKLR